MHKEKLKWAQLQQALFVAYPTATSCQQNLILFMIIQAGHDL